MPAKHTSSSVRWLLAGPAIVPMEEPLLGLGPGFNLRRRKEVLRPRAELRFALL